MRLICVLFWLRFTGEAVAKKQQDRERGIGMDRKETRRDWVIEEA